MCVEYVILILVLMELTHATYGLCTLNVILISLCRFQCELKGFNNGINHVKLEFKWTLVISVSTNQPCKNSQRMQHLDFKM